MNLVFGIAAIVTLAASLYAAIQGDYAVAAWLAVLAHIDRDIAKDFA